VFSVAKSEPGAAKHERVRANARQGMASVRAEGDCRKPYSLKARQFTLWGRSG